MVYESDVDTLVNDNCYLVKKGVRSVYCDIIEVDVLDEKRAYKLLDEITDVAKEYGLICLYRILDKKDVYVTMEFWIFKHPYLKRIIESIPPKNRTYEQEWMMGKLLGYDDESMAEHMSKFN